MPYFYGSHRRSVEYAYYILYYAKVIEILLISVTSLQIVTLAGKPQLMDLVWRSFEHSAEALTKLQPAQNQAKKQCSLKDCLTEVIGSMKDIDPKNVSIPL